MSGTITFSGLASGLDSSKLISELMKAEHQPIDRLQATQSGYSSQVGKLNSLKAKLDALRSAVSALATRADVSPAKASSSDTGVIKASAAGGASLGTSTVHVTRLASAERTYSNAFSASDQTGLVGTGTLTLQVGTDTPVQVAIDATDTLESVASKIQASGAPVTAGLMFDGTSYRLRVSGTRTGDAGAITFTESGTQLGLDLPANEVQAAQDALFEVDGFAMRRASNTVSDAIDGVTLTLVAPSPTAATATVEVLRDDSTLRDRVQKLVDAYNDVHRSISAESAYLGTAKGKGSLSGDSTIRSLQSALRSAVGQAGGARAYTTLASIGVATQRDGSLSLDATQLDRAMAADPDAVSTLLAGVSGAEGAMARLTSTIDAYAKGDQGILNTRVRALEGRSKGIDDQIDRLQLRLDRTEERLRKQFSALEGLVSNLTAQGNQLTAALSSLDQGK